VKRSIDLLLLIIWIIVIFILTGLPGLESPKIREFPIDKFYHFLLFFIYGILGIRLMPLVFYFSSGLLIVVSAEVQQIFIPGRSFEIPDMVSGAVGLIVVYLIYQRKHRQKI